ncbi:MAG TPA: AMP-binding protein [Xanthobacteraceae bacterium]
MHVAAIWRELAARHGTRAAVADEHETLSYRQFHARITRCGNALRGLGLVKGDRVALLIPDIREYLEVDYAIMAAGFVRVPLDPRLARSELAALLRYAGARALVTHASFAPAIEQLREGVEDLRHLITIGGGIGFDYERLLERASELPLPEGDGDDLASLNFSGGTTGAPKAAKLRHRNLVTVAHNTIDGFGVRRDSVFLNVRPLWPVAQVVLMSHLFAGATVVLRRFDPEAFATFVCQHGATRTSLVPTQLVRLIDHLRPRDTRLGRLQAIHVGGSRIPPAMFERALELLGPRIGVLYGLTEAPVTTYLAPAALEPEGARVLMQSVGRVLGDYQVRIAGTDDTPPVGSGRSGEVLIRGGNVMAGYWRDEAASRAALREGWLHTGDIGEFDDGGNLHIVGRLKEVIRSGSSTVIPKEVEDVIVLHPAVAEVAVIGLPDPEWGEAVTAFVVTKPGMSVAEGDLVEHCRQRLAGYKKPRSIRFVASLPRSHYGKVLRAQLIAQATK